MEELKTWLEHFISHTEKKLEYMKISQPSHRNVERFEGEINMAKKVLKK